MHKNEASTEDNAKAYVISGSISVDLSFNSTSSRKHADIIVRVFKGVSASFAGIARSSAKITNSRARECSETTDSQVYKLSQENLRRMFLLSGSITDPSPFSLPCVWCRCIAVETSEQKGRK